MSNTSLNGGGLFVMDSYVTLDDNNISANTSTQAGGLFLPESIATLNNNIISANVAEYNGGGLGIYGGDATLRGNTISFNSASWGGGLALVEESTATLDGNSIVSNTVTHQGGGLALYDSDATLLNNVIADNQAGTSGSGLYIYRSSPRLLHNTLARNHGGDGSGICVTNYGGEYISIALTNTILVSHSIGISVTAGNTVTLKSTLWNGNDVNWGGAGYIVHERDYDGDPAFVSPNSGDYHIGPGSAARDAGVDAGVSVDIDGDPRPAGAGYDLGADEFYIPALAVTKQAYPSLALAGEALTYTLRVTNTGTLTLHATISDTLPQHIMPGGTLILPGGALTWTATLPAPGGVWTETLVVTVEQGYAGPLTNTVRVTTLEGAESAYIEVSAAALEWHFLYLPLLLKEP